MTAPATRTCAARNAAGGPCRAPVMRAALFCCAHNFALPVDRRFGTAEQAKAAGLLGGRPPAKRHEQLMLPVDGVADGPPTDPRAVLARAAWEIRIRRGVAALDPAGRAAYDQALEDLNTACHVRDRAVLDEDELLEAEAKRRIPGFIDAVGAAAGAGPWPR